MAARKTNPLKEVSMSSGSGMNVSVREIENGFIVRNSGYVGKGKNQKYMEKEVFSKKNPIKVSGVPSMTFSKK